MASEDRREWPTPLAVLAIPRSGSTRFMEMLYGHPEIVVAPPPPFEASLMSFWSRVAMLVTKHPGREDFRRAATWAKNPGPAIGANPFLRSGSGADKSFVVEMRQAQRSHLVRLFSHDIRRYYHHLAQGQGKAPVRFFAEKILGGPPLAKVGGPAQHVLLVREPMHNVASWLDFRDRRVEERKLPPDTTDAQVTHLIQCLTGMAAARERFPDAPIVRYEDVMADPARALRPVLSSLGLHDDDVMARMLDQSVMDPEWRLGHRTAPEGRDDDALRSAWQRAFPEGTPDAAREAWETLGYSVP